MLNSRATAIVVVAGIGNCARQLDRAVAEIVVVDADDEHVYQPGLPFVPFGLLARPEALVRPRQHQLRSGVGFHCSAVDHVDLENDTVLLADGTSLGYDVLVVAGEGLQFLLAGWRGGTAAGAGPV
jgi:NADH dehydrogenase FAD-containing subunit